MLELSELWYFYDCNLTLIRFFDTKFSWEVGRLTKAHAFKESPFTLIAFKRNPFNSPIPCYKQSHLKMENIKLWTFRVRIKCAQSERILYDTGLIREGAKHEKWKQTTCRRVRWAMFQPRSQGPLSRSWKLGGKYSWNVDSCWKQNTILSANRRTRAPHHSTR